MSKFHNPRIVHTNFYSAEFRYLLNRFFCYLATVQEKRMSRNGYLAAAENAPDDEVIIEFGVNEFGWYKTAYAKKKTDAEILDWIGWMMKVKTHEFIEGKWLAYNLDEAAAKKAAKAAEWKRDGNLVVPFLSFNKYISAKELMPVDVRVKDVYFIYEALKNRKNCDRHYDEAIIKRWRGQKKDPLATQMEVARRAEIEHVRAEYKQLIDDWNPDYHFAKKTKAYLELGRIIDEFKAKCEAERDRLKDERDKKLEELENMRFIAI